mgnify:CR=1 FL=1
MNWKDNKTVWQKKKKNKTNKQTKKNTISIEWKPVASLSVTEKKKNRYKYVLLS